MQFKNISKGRVLIGSRSFGPGGFSLKEPMSETVQGQVDYFLDKGSIKLVVPSGKKEATPQPQKTQVPKKVTPKKKTKPAKKAKKAALANEESKEKEQELPAKLEDDIQPKGSLIVDSKDDTPPAGSADTETEKN